MSRWATIDNEKLQDEIELLEGKIVSLAECPFSKIGEVTLPYAKAIPVARLLGTYDALVTISNCLADGGGRE